ncbi:hypothetical protein STUTZSP0542_07560 [Stutzerimonas marianensis]
MPVPNHRLRRGGVKSIEAAELFGTPVQIPKEESALKVGQIGCIAWALEMPFEQTESSLGVANRTNWNRSSKTSITPP